MKQVIGILLIIGALWGAKNLFNHWEQVKKREAVAAGEVVEEAPAPVAPAVLPGMPEYLEASLAEAKGSGAASLKIWLNRHRADVHDPRLAEIELDYLVLAGARDYAEGKKMFQSVKGRIPSDSPLYPRIEQLAPNYE